MGYWTSCSPSQVGKLRFLRSLPQVFKGTQVDNDEITMLRGAEVEIECGRGLRRSTPTASTSQTCRPSSTFSRAP